MQCSVYCLEWCQYTNVSHFSVVFQTRSTNSTISKSYSKFISKRNVCLILEISNLILCIISNLYRLTLNIFVFVNIWYSNVLRDTRKRKLQSLELPNAEKTERTVFIGDADKDFEWHHLQQNVQFYDCSAKVEHQLNNLTDWLDRML